MGFLEDMQKTFSAMNGEDAKQVEVETPTSEEIEEPRVLSGITYNYDDEISFVLPYDWDYVDETDEDGNENFTIGRGEHYDDEAEDFIFDDQINQIEILYWGDDEIDKTHSSGDFIREYSEGHDPDASLKNVVIESPLPIEFIFMKKEFNILSIKKVANVIVACYEASPEELVKLMVITYERDSDDFDLESVLKQKIEFLLELVSYTCYKGEPLPELNVDSSELLEKLIIRDFEDDDPINIGFEINVDINGHQTTYEYGDNGFEKASEFEPATVTVDDKQYPHYKSIKWNPLAFLGNVVVNSTGTEYNFISLVEQRNDLEGEGYEVLDRIINSDNSDYSLDEKALEMARLFRVSEAAFDKQHDRECEINEDLLHRAYMYNGLRSFAWTLAKYCEDYDCTPEDVDISIVKLIITHVVCADWLNYDETLCPGLCKGQDLHVYFVPDAASESDKNKLWPNEELLERVKKLKEENPGYNPILSQVNSLDDLRRDLEYIYPAIQLIFDDLSEDRDVDEPLVGNEADILYAWCAVAYAARRPFFSEDGPCNCWFSQIEDDYVPVSTSKVKTTRTKSSTLSKPVEVDIDDLEIEDDILIGYSGCETNIILPEYEFTEIGENCFENLDIESIVIPDGVTIIGEWAFQNCKNLKKVILPDSLDEIRDNAFIHCEGLESIDIPDGVTEIGEDAFSWCTSIKELKIPSSVTDVGLIGSPFFGMDNLEKVYFCDGIESLGDLFSCCNNIREIYVPESVSLIKELFTTNNKTVVHVVHGSYAEEWFEEDGIVEEIRTDYNLLDFDIEDDVDEPIENNSGLGVGNIFKMFGMYSPGEIEYDQAKNSDFIISDGVVEKYIGSKTRISIPTGVTEIGEGAFSLNDSIEAVQIPEGVITIGSEAFATSRGIVEINLPSTLEEIGNHAFIFTNLQELKLPEGLKYIGECAFQNCRNIHEMTIPESVEFIGEGAFSCMGRSLFSSDDTGATVYVHKDLKSLVEENDLTYSTKINFVFYD